MPGCSAICDRGAPAAEAPLFDSRRVMLAYVAIWLISAGAAFTQAISGFGFAMLAVPLMAPLVGPQGAVVTTTMLSGLLTAGTSVTLRAQVHWRAVIIVSAAAICGIPLGLVALQLLDENWLALIIGLLVIAVTLLLASRVQWNLHGGSAMTAAGVMSGALLSSTGLNGPPLVAVFQSLRMRPQVFRASLQAAFLVQDGLACLGFVIVGRISGSTLAMVASSLPWLLVGWWLGDRAFGRVSERAFRRIVLGILLLSGVLAVGQAIVAFS